MGPAFRGQRRDGICLTLIPGEVIGLVADWIEMYGYRLLAGACLRPDTRVAELVADRLTQWQVIELVAD